MISSLAPRAAAWLAAICLIVLAACKESSGPTEPKFGSISGSVGTLEGAAIVGARLTVSGPQSVGTTTNASGDFAMSNLPEGTYRLELRVPTGFDPVPQGGDTIGGVLVVQSLSVSGSKTLRFWGRARLTDSVQLSPGTRDTLVTASGAVLEVDAASASAAVEVKLEESGTRSLDQFGGTTAPLALHIAPAGTSGAPPAGHARARNAVMGTVGIRLIQRGTGFDPSVTKFVFNVGTEADPLYMWADAQSTTYVDPRTSQTVTVPLYSATVDFSTPIDAWISAARVDDECASTRYLRPVDGLPGSGARIPLIFIHGWQFDRLICSQFESFNPREETLRNLINFVMADADLSRQYRPYVLRYPTMARVLSASDFLWGELKGQGLSGAVLIGHSMGGLVGRGLMMTHRSDSVHDAVRALITLGTPHEGSVLAEGFLAAEMALYGPSAWITAKLLGLTLFPLTHGVDDLRPSGAFITRLHSATGDGPRTFTIGGRIGGPGGTDDFFAKVGAAALDRLGQTPNDGIVPVASAVPSWSALQSVVSGYDHFEIGSKGIPSDDALLGRVKALLATLGGCVAPPDPPAVNDFSLSGGIARVGTRQVDVTLNPIVIDGSPVTGLGQDNFKIIENGCVLPSTITTGEGSVGVDIVFAQDLSGSMYNAIAGVRSSVRSLAADLAARGFNVRFGSVGYSGPGTIPTTPPTSDCEFLGPVRDLTDATTFQAHVQSQWILGFGCDDPENGLEAIEYGHNHMSWRTGAARVYIDITDVSHHTATTNCNGYGPCTDETLASIVALVGGTSTIHAIATTNASWRTTGGGLDPWLLADATGGRKLDLGSGYVDLTALGISDIVAQTIRLSFQSASPDAAYHTLRVRVEVGGKVAELSPGMIQYAPIHPSLVR